MRVRNGFPHAGMHCCSSGGHGVIELIPETQEFDPVQRPAHYHAGSIEPIDAIEDWKLGFSLGNAVKYIARHRHKGTPLEDLKKARWYLDREIARLEKSQ